MSRIVLAGNVNVDSVKMLSQWPERGRLVNVSDVRRSVGGCVSNSGIDLKILDPSVSVGAIARIGADEPGEFARATLDAHGIETDGLMTVEGLGTATVDCLTVEGAGDRTFLFAKGAGATLVPDDIDVSKLDCGIFHLGYLLLLDGLDAVDEEYGTKAARLLAKVQAAGIRTSIDVVSEQSDRFQGIVKPALRHCDYVVINEVEASLATGVPETDMRGMCEALMACGVRERAVVHCPAKSASLDADGRYSELGSLILPKGWIVGSTGAGDAFCAGMLLSFLRGMDATDGMRLASCAAACNLSVADSISGAKSADESLLLDKRFERRPV